MILGAVLAGGRSTRFGSDKALAILDGQTLLERAVEGLGKLCDAVVVVGRDEAPVPVLADRPRGGMGPLGGIAAALHHAVHEGFASVLSWPVDALGLCHAVTDRLEPAPSFIRSQPVIGLWPANVLPVVDGLLAGQGRHSLWAFAEAIGARPVEFPDVLLNINTQADLVAAQRP